MNTKRISSFVVAVAMATSFLLPSVVMAALPGPSTATYTTGIYVSNRGASAANAVIDFYGAGGGSPAASYTLPSPIAVGGYAYVFVGITPAGLSGGLYSAVVSADQDVVALANTWGSKSITVNSVPKTAVVRDSYVSFQASDIATTLYAPVVQNNYYTNKSSLMIQNTTGTAGNIRLTVRNALGANAGQIAGAFNYPIGANGYVAISLDALGLASGNAAGLYGAMVTSTVAIAGIASTSTDSADGGGNFGGVPSSAKPALLQYPMKASGSTTIYAAKNLKGYYNIISSLNIQNLGAVTATVKLTYTTQSGNFVYTQNIGPGATWVELTFNRAELPGVPLGQTTSSNTALYPAIATSNQPLLAIIQPVDLKKGDIAASVAGTPSDLSTSLFVPIAYKERTTGMSGGKLFSSMTFVNPGATAAIIYVRAGSYPAAAPMILNATQSGGQAVLTLVGAASWSALPLDALSSLSITSTQPIFGVVGVNDLSMFTAGQYGDSNHEFNAIK